MTSLAQPTFTPLPTFHGLGATEGKCPYYVTYGATFAAKQIRTTMWKSTIGTQRLRKTLFGMSNTMTTALSNCLCALHAGLAAQEFVDEVSQLSIRVLL